MKKLAVLVQLAGVLLLSGCAIGNRYAYQTVVASPQVSGTTAVSIATYDQREYVRSGTKDPQFVGLQRGGYGNPFDVRTEGDRPLADAMTTAPRQHAGEERVPRPARRGGPLGDAGGGAPAGDRRGRRARALADAAGMEERHRGESRAEL